MDVCGAGLYALNVERQLIPLEEGKKSDFLDTFSLYHLLYAHVEGK